jgi:uncharacterized protein YkwD
MKTLLKPFLLFSALLIISGTTVCFAQTLTATTNTTKVPTTVNQTKMLQLVNNVRSKGCQCGDTYYYPVPPIVWNTQLETAAYNHTADMAKNNFFSHTGMDGNRGGNRLERGGYHWKTYGENIGQGYKTEKEMIDGWLASPGHCKNIMNKTYTEMGVARVGNLWTQEFGSR